jgi:peptidoglycan/LPS O-acetylase OafA/YrhL
VDGLVKGLGGGSARSRHQTIEQRMAATKGHSSGFDVLRIAFAVFVLCWHSIYSSYGTDGWLWEKTWFRPIPAIIIPMFFALSGFLVANSLYRSRSLSSFVTLRVLRLVPALFVLVAFTTLIIGPIVTTLPLGDYFSAGQFWIYWLNVIGDAHFSLPGVFKGNPVHDVNVSLWTIPYELEGYGALILLFAAGLLRRLRPLAWVLVIAGLALLLQEYFAVGFEQAAKPPGRFFLACFLAGVGLYAFREHVVLSRKWFAIALFAAYVFLARAETAFYAALPVAYLTVYVGLLTLPRIPVVMDGDYSYGLYLYAFPMQQIYEWIDPLSNYWRTAPYDRVWWVNIVFALPCAFSCAVLSWHFVEEPIMSRRKQVTELVARAEAALLLRLKSVLGRPVY